MCRIVKFSHGKYVTHAHSNKFTSYKIERVAFSSIQLSNRNKSNEGRLKSCDNSYSETNVSFYWNLLNSQLQFKINIPHRRQPTTQWCHRHNPYAQCFRHYYRPQSFKSTQRPRSSTLSRSQLVYLLAKVFTRAITPQKHKPLYVRVMEASLSARRRNEMSFALWRKCCVYRTHIHTHTHSV